MHSPPNQPGATCAALGAWLPDARLVALVSSVLAGLVVSALWAGDGRLGESVEVELVNVEVRVTDREGQPVEGLPAEAFRVWEDDEEQNLAFFAEVRGGRKTTGAADPGSSSASDSVSTATADAGHFVVYFDDLHLSTQSRERATEDLHALLDAPGVDPGRILVLRQDLSLYVEAPFGSDRAEIEAALDRLAEPRTSEGSHAIDQQAALRHLRDEWRKASQGLPSLPTDSSSSAGVRNSRACNIFLKRIMPYIEFESTRARDRISTTIEHLGAVSSYLSAMPGVKSLLYFSDSLETTPGSSLEAFVSGICPTGLFYREKADVSGNLSEAFLRLARIASAHRVTFYGLQGGGMRVNIAFSAENESVDLRSASRYQRELRGAERTGLQYLATETGGRAITGRNDLGEPISEIAEDSTSYYSLAYTPDHPGASREHKIRVELTDAYDRRGLRVRHRRGYFHEPADGDFVEKLQAALYLGIGENPLRVRLGAGSPALSTRTVPATETSGVSLPLHVYVPARAVTFVPAGEGTTARIFIQVAVRSSAGDPAEPLRKTWTIRGPAEDDAVFDLPMDLELAGGLTTIAVGVRDEVSREASFISVRNLQVPRATAVASEE